MRKLILATAALTLLSFSAVAQAPSPIGKWKTLDDETGRAMTVVEMYRAQDGTLAAKIVENIAAPPTCTKCSGADKGRSIIGMNVLWGLQPIDGGYGNGQGFKPSSGDQFRARSVRLIEGGNKLEVTGCKRVLVEICRTATWVRAD